jgi:hypothetical protein
MHARCISLRTRTTVRGRCFSALDRPEEWERQSLGTLGSFVCTREGIDPSNRADFHRALSRLPAPKGCLGRGRERTLRDLTVRTLRHLVAVIAADSDLTKPPEKDDSLKEVIQPHLPVRLPCYDFTPLTGHSFGTSVPCGFGQRLREHQTRVV